MGKYMGELFNGKIVEDELNMKINGEYREGSESFCDLEKKLNGGRDGEFEGEIKVWRD